MSKKAKIFNSIPLTKILVLFFVILFLNSCAAFKPKKSEPASGPEKARKNIEEGRGVSIGSAMKGIRRGTTYEIRSDSLKITLHQRICRNAINCKIDLIQKSNLRDELRRTILKKASLIEKEQKEKK